METAQHSQKLTYPAYKLLDAQSEIGYEFEAGHVVAMAGGTLNHNTLTGNIQAVMKPQLRQQSCRVFTENVKLEVLKGTSYRYPDVVVACHPFDLRGIINLFISHD